MDAERTGGRRDADGGIGSKTRLGSVAPKQITLSIDGRERTGWAWGEAAYRVASYVTDRRTDGSVRYEYRLRIRGYDVRRSTRIENGSVVLTTDVWGSIGPNGELYRVRLTITADESGTSTRLRGTITGDSRIGDRCGLVERVAERIISRELAFVLRRIEDEGRGLYASGDIHQLGNVLIERLTR
jgi:hypothetical protein